MCFYDNDCDWFASIADESTFPAEKPTRCDECGRLIPIGDTVRHIFQQEHEECQNGPCGDNYEGPETDSYDCPEGCDHDFGKTANYDCCETCVQLIEAIHQHELSEGCRDDESRPPLEGLYDALSEGDGKSYLAKAETLYPGITGRLTERFLYAINRGEDD